MKVSRIGAAPKRVQKTSPEMEGIFSGQNTEYQEELTYFETLSLKKTNRLFYSFSTMLLFDVLGHINPKEVNRIPDFPSGEHREDSSQNHSSNGDDGPLFTPALGNAFIFHRIVGIQLVLHGCVSNLYQRRFEINSGT